MKGFAMMICVVVAACTMMIHVAATGSATSTSGAELLEGVQIPPNISVPAGNRLHVAYSAEGHQHYGFNGSAWLLLNATAKLYADVAHDVLVGHHLFLVPGGQPTWHALGSQVTAQGLVAVTVDSDSITWNLLQAVSHSGDTEPLGAVTYVQRVKTRRGLPPSTKDVKEGDTHASKYSCVYGFYVKS